MAKGANNYPKNHEKGANKSLKNYVKGASYDIIYL
jgi:hypothetical protein